MNQPKPPTSDWLKKLQQKSWEPEILLSGIVLVGMLQVPEILDRFFFFVKGNIDRNISNNITLFVAPLKMGVYWLILGLILHLVCRSIWIGTVGLSDSFSEGIQSKKLRFQPGFLKIVEAIPTFEIIILKLEKVCSTIFSISFFLFMSLVGSYVYLLALIILPLFGLAYFDLKFFSSDAFILVLNIYMVLVIIIGLVALIDFTTAGFFRRFRFFSKIYWPFYAVVRRLTLAKYYQPTYYGLITNLKRRWVFIFLILFVIINLYGISSLQNEAPVQSFSRIDIWSEKSQYRIREGFYQDKHAKFPSELIQIPSDIIENNTIRVFVPAQIIYQDSLKKFMKYDSIQGVSEAGFNKDLYMLQKVEEFYDLIIADSTFKTKMYFQYNTESSQRGYITFLDVSHLARGLYELSISGPPKMYHEPFAIVPFYKASASE